MSMVTRENKHPSKLALLGLVIGISLGIMLLVVVMRIWFFSTTSSGGGYIEYPVFNMLPPLVIAFALRYALSPKKRSLPAAMLIFVVLLVTGIVQEYLVARHMALAAGVAPSSAPLLPTLPQYLAVMASNILGISFVLIGVFAGTLLALIMKDMTATARR